MANETGAERFAKESGMLTGAPSIFHENVTLDPLADWQKAVAYRFAEAYKDFCTQELRARIKELEAEAEKDDIETIDSICRFLGEPGEDRVLTWRQVLAKYDQAEKAEAEVRELKATCDSDLRDWKKLAEELGCEATREAMSKYVRELKAQLNRSGRQR